MIGNSNAIAAYCEALVLTATQMMKAVNRAVEATADHNLSSLSQHCMGHGCRNLHDEPSTIFLNRPVGRDGAEEEGDRYDT